MIFDELWRAERRAKKVRKRIDEKYNPLLGAAKKKKDKDEYDAILSGLMSETDLNEDEPRLIRTRRLVNRARKSGIPVPPQPAPLSDDVNDNETWFFNYTTGNFYLSDSAEAELTREVRKEERERWQLLIAVIGIIIGLIGAIMALISLAHSLK